jgi:glycolate oxidase iron-sulfur subunit
LNHALISPRRIEFFAWPVRLAQRLRLDKLGLALFGWIPKIGPAVRDLMLMAPKLSKPLWKELAKPPRVPKTSEVSSAQYRVGFFLGCVMNVAFADASRASITVLKRFGCDVITPQDQMCCGAPQDDQGLKDQARRMAKRNIEAFEKLGELDVIVADCAACSGFLKEYRHVFHDDPAWAARADRFADKVRDITEWLDQIMPDALPLLDRETIAPGAERRGGAGVRVTYHEPCHLVNVQGVRRQPRALLMRLKNTGIDVRDLPDATRCCGSAGIYNLTHPAMSKDLLDRKMADVASTGAQVVVSANPGCLLQLDWGAKRAKLDVQVKHITQVLAEALEKT